MDSANHQLGASAAPPHQASPLPEPNTGNNRPICKAKTVATKEASTTTTTASIATTTKTISPTSTSSSSMVAMSTCASSTKKRPLVSVSPSSTTRTESETNTNGSASLTPIIHKDTSVPVLKKHKKADATKVPPVKSKKTLKKKKKKFSSILSGMMKPKKAVDLCAERESLRKHLGGGNFAKVEKI